MVSYKYLILYNFFNITNIDYNRNGVKEKKSDRFESGDKNNCHEIKVMKNNKVVYINSNLDNSFSPSKNLKKLNKIIFIDRGKRGSKYRGVSRNGNQWQVLIMLHKSKSYVGTYSANCDAINHACIALYAVLVRDILSPPYSYTSWKLSS